MIGPPHGFKFTAVDELTHWKDNCYSESEWEEMENLGVIFLPPCGHRKMRDVRFSGEQSLYWGTSLSGETAEIAYFIGIVGNYLYGKPVLKDMEITTCYRFHGHGVRLVGNVSIKNFNVCPGDSIVWNDSVYKEPGAYRQTYKSITVKDSFALLQLTVYPTYQDTVYDTICANQAYTWNKHTLSPYHKKQLSQITYTDTFASVHGCDSITTLQLTVIPSFNDTVHYDIGIGDTFSLWGISYTDPGFYIASYRSSDGCDSTITHWVHKKIVSEEADIIETSAVRVEPTVLNACQRLHIRVPEISQMWVYDMSGRLVHFSTLSEGGNGYAVPCVCGIYNVVIESSSQDSLQDSSPKRSIVRILVM